MWNMKQKATNELTKQRKKITKLIDADNRTWSAEKGVGEGHKRGKGVKYK